MQSAILYLLIHGGLFELFTNDTATLSSLRHIEPILVLCQPINSVSYVLDGVVQDRGEFKFQAKASGGVRRGGGLMVLWE